MIYAPVIIATLNRYDHLKRCLESLERNEWAKYTEVFISVDYPVKEAHWDGYRKIQEYLKNKKSGFKSMQFFIQEKNLGPGMNYKFLRNIAFQKYDRVIILEDDIETAPNFLEYMDKALEFGQSNPDVYCVCGYYSALRGAILKEIEGKEFFLKTAFNPWGWGEYLVQREEMLGTLSKEWLDKTAGSLKAMFTLYKYRKYTFYLFVVQYLMNKSELFFNADGSIREVDIAIDIYMLLNQKAAVFPTMSKTKNWGFDGSGANCGKKDGEDKQKLDGRKHITIEEHEAVRLSKKTMRRLSYAGVADRKELYKAAIWYIVYYIRTFKVKSRSISKKQ